jgi:uncharacterized protein
MKKQVVVIHGGDSYGSDSEFLSALRDKKVTKESFLPKYDWKSFLSRELGESFEVLAPRMPNKQNAKYDEWKVWLEKMFPFLGNSVVLIGHSMGGTFLVKYLSQNNFPKKIKALFLVASPHDLGGRVREFRLARDLGKVWKQCQNIHIFHSADDQVVPVSEAEMYKENWPEAVFHLLDGRGHFNQESFPEILAEIRKS